MIRTRFLVRVTAVLVALFRAAVTSGERSDRILTLCSSCMRLHAGREWISITRALADFLAAPKSHGLCPDCLRSLYPDVADRVFEEIALLEMFTDT
jgi:hypothetical protein